MKSADQRMGPYECLFTLVASLGGLIMATVYRRSGDIIKEPELLFWFGIVVFGFTFVGGLRRIKYSFHGLGAHRYGHYLTRVSFEAGMAFVMYTGMYILAITR